MASSWNLAAAQTSSVAEDVTSKGASLWQSVVDGAAEALASGKEAIIDVAEDVYDYLPEQEDVMDAAATGVEAAGSVLPAIMDTAQAAGEGLMGSGLSEFKFLASNFFDAGGTLTEENLNGSDLSALASAVKKLRLQADQV